MNNIIEFLQKSTEKINSAISDIDYASSYSRSSASSSYCSYAQSTLRNVKEELMSIATKLDNPVEILKKCTNKINNAISDINYASSYSKSTASLSYCNHAKSSLRNVQKELNEILSKTDKTKEPSSEENFERTQ